MEMLNATELTMVISFKTNMYRWIVEYRDGPSGDCSDSILHGIWRTSYEEVCRTAVEEIRREVNNIKYLRSYNINYTVEYSNNVYIEIPRIIPVIIYDNNKVIKTYDIY